jgi:DNA-binding transcriptional ArsR family regulator
MQSTTAAHQVEILDDVSRVAAVLSPIRRRILESFDQPESATEVARRLDLPRQKVNYHLRELEREGFLELAEERRRRGCVERRLRPTARSYVINPALLGRLTVDPDQVRDRFSSTYLIAVAARIVREVNLLRRRAARVRKRLATLTLQADINFRSPAARTAFAEELSDTVARLTAKYHDPSPGSRKYRVIVGGHPVITKTQKETEDEYEY